jgi:hypothetical protein
MKNKFIMEKIFILISLCFFILFSCENKTSSNTKSDITGAYFRDYSFEVKNMSTDQVVGIQNVRDTIFIKEKENGYEVSNAKYRMNDYDQNGWISIGGTEKLPTFQATFDQTDNSLLPVQNQFVSPIYFDLNKEVLFKNNDRNYPYQKVR